MAFTSDLLNVTNGTTTGTVDIPIDLDLSSFVGVTDLTFRFYFLGNNNATSERTRIVGPLSLFGTEAVIPGDYNSDGKVDAADYTIWRDNENSTSNLAADGNGDGNRQYPGLQHLARQLWHGHKQLHQQLFRSLPL